MIIVTGGAGFVGSRIVKALNHQGERDILVVDDLKDGRKFVNLVNAQIMDYIDRDTFFEKLDGLTYSKAAAVFHQGACSDTTEWDGEYMMKYNYQYSKKLLDFSQRHEIPFLYASSAAVYGASEIFAVSPDNEKPLNIYGYSKLLFDQYVRRILHKLNAQVVGLRYFNVYGPGEFHKGNMASVAYHFNQQIKTSKQLQLFGAYGDYAAGEQHRDFVYVDDVVDVNLWFWKHPNITGIYNVGTGQAQTFNEMAQAVIDYHGEGAIDYIPFPDHLKGAYQSFTQADLSALRGVGYDKSFRPVQAGIPAYLDTENLS